MNEQDRVLTVLRGFWADALDMETVELDDNFFELGGYSLLAMRITAQVNNAFDLDIPMALLFRHSTLRKFAAAVREQSSQAGPDDRSE